jgi:hypothetical protein
MHCVTYLQTASAKTALHRIFCASWPISSAKTNVMKTNQVSRCLDLPDSTMYLVLTDFHVRCSTKNVVDIDGRWGSVFSTCGIPE